MANSLVESGNDSHKIVDMLRNAVKNNEGNSFLLMEFGIYSLITTDYSAIDSYKPLFPDSVKIADMLFAAGITSQEQLDEFLAKYSEN